MRRFAALAAALAVLLSGCGQSRGIYSNYRPIEDLLLVRTLGIDAAGRGLVLSAAAGRPQGGAPALLRRGASSIPQGMAALQSRSPDGQLYFAHTQSIVLGEDFAAGGIGELLDFVERDIRTRMGAALYLVRGGTAEALITGAGGDRDVSEMLSTVRAETEARGDSHVFDVRETAVALSEYGAALICALRVVGAEDSVSEAPAGRAAVPDGFGILRDGALIGFLPGAQARAAGLLLGKLGTVTREIPDGAGGTVTAELSCGAPEISFLRGADGSGDSLRIRVAPSAVIAALDTPREDILSAAALDALAAVIDETLRRDLEAILARSRAENADFLALKRALRTQGVDPDGLPADWLQSLDVRVEVETCVRHSYDMDAPAGMNGGGAS